MHKNNYEIIGKEKVFCPFCEKEHTVEKCRRETIAAAQGNKISFPREYFVCDEHGEDLEFETAELMAENLQRARSAYRKVILKKEE